MGLLFKQAFHAVLAACLLLVLASALSQSLGADGEAGPPSPNGAVATRVVLVTLDTARFDAVVGGSRDSAMPRTLAFVEEHGGVTFDRHYTASNVTQPTHASLFTGLHPWQHGVTGNSLVLADGFDTVPERLRAAGFDTHAVVSSFPLSRRFGFDQGFEHWVEVFDRELVPGMDAWHGVGVADGRFYSLADAVTSAALAQLRRVPAGAPDPKDAGRAARHLPSQFFWFHYFDAHDPYGDSLPGQSPLSLPDLHDWAYERAELFPRKLRQARELYRADLANIDRELARVLARLAEDFDRVRTHIVITADHGESFGERGRLGHGRSLDAAEIHAPLFVVSPRFDAGRRADPVGSVDVAGLLLSLAGIEGGAGDGRDLLASPTPPAGSVAAAGMKSRPPADQEVDPAGSRDRFFAVVDGTVFEGDSEAAAPSSGTPESVDGSAAAAARELFRAFEMRLSGVSAERRVDPETERALRALGYTR